MLSVQPVIGNPLNQLKDYQKFAEGDEGSSIADSLIFKSYENFQYVENKLWVEENTVKADLLMLQR